MTRYRARRIVAAPPEAEKQQEFGLYVETSLRSLERGVGDLGAFVEQGHTDSRAHSCSRVLLRWTRKVARYAGW